MEMNNVYQQLGRLQSKVEALEKGQKSASDKLDTLLRRSASERGARGAIWRVAGASGTLGGLLVAFVTWWQGKH